LINLLAKSLADARLTLVSAPAGSGKTALVAELPHAFPETAWGWLLLDSEDDDDRDSRPRDERECPFCAEMILKKARVCKHCGRDVEPITA